MSAIDLRNAIAAIDSAISRLTLDKYRLTLQLEEYEERPDSHAARFARAALAHDVEAMTRLCAEGEVKHLREFGHLPQQEIRDEVERILAESESEADAAMFADHPSHSVAPVEFEESPGPSTSEDHNPGAIQQ